ncbi:hypothetical protein J3A83DRAFT_4381329 [Scleroderma citrinum]
MFHTACAPPASSLTLVPDVAIDYATTDCSSHPVSVIHVDTSAIFGTLDLDLKPSEPPLWFFEDVLYCHYGFLGLPTSAHETMFSGLVELGRVKKYFGEGSAPMSPSKSLQQAIAKFSEALLKTSTHLVKHLCDLGDGSLKDQYKFNFTVAFDHFCGCLFQLSGKTKEYDCYIIHPHTPAGTDYSIILYEPEAALQVIHSKCGPSVDDVAVDLMNAGIQFTTMALHHGLCNYGRAALMKGGIIAHIARDIVGDHAEAIIRSGPTETVTQYGATLCFGRIFYLDDDLIEGEEEIICGIYKILTGQSGEVTMWRSTQTKATRS